MAGVQNAAMPADNDLTQGYSLRVTALDTSGVLVAGVKVGVTVVTVDPLTAGDLTAGTFAPFRLVPGPAA